MRGDGRNDAFVSLITKDKARNEGHSYKCPCAKLIRSKKNEGFFMIGVDELQRGIPAIDETEQDRPSRLIATPVGGCAPTLVLMAGFAGAGKTTLSQWLQAKLNWKIINKDELKLEFLRRGVERDQAGEYAFNRLLELTQEALLKGEAAIVDTSNEQPFIFEKMQAMLEHVEQKPMILFCLADKQKRTERLEQRGSVFYPYYEREEIPDILDDSQLSTRLKHLLPDEYQDMLANPALLQQAIYPLKRGNVLFINTDQPQENYANTVLKNIKAYFNISKPFLDK